jgi:hypothetical protein
MGARAPYFSPTPQKNDRVSSLDNGKSTLDPRLYKINHNDFSRETMKTHVLKEENAHPYLGMDIPCQPEAKDMAAGLMYNDQVNIHSACLAMFWGKVFTI